MFELQLSPDSFGAIIVMLICAAVLTSLILGQKVLAMVGVRRFRSSRALLISRLTLAGLVGVQIVIWHLYLNSQSHTSIHLGVIVLAWVVGLALCFAAILDALQWSPWVSRHIPTFFVLVALLQLVGFVRATTLFSTGEATLTSFPVLPKPRPVADLVQAITDRGTNIPLFIRKVDATEAPEIERFLHSQIVSITDRAMLMDDAPMQANCHGWVFTRGKYIVRNEDVSLILAENAYAEVNAPQAGDVVVYYDSNSGDVSHTGIVRGFLDDQSVLIESKWGINGTYLHLVDQQPYGLNYKYFRTDRGSHELIYIDIDD